MKAAAFALALWAGGTAAAPTSAVLPPEAKVEGATQADYAARWWQWAHRVRPGLRPYQDPSGRLCALDQDGPVWFLAGTDGTERPTRLCRVPVGKHVFLPVLNMLAHAVPGTPHTCAKVQAMAAENNDAPIVASVTIDDETLADVRPFRQRTTCFDAFPDAPYLTEPAAKYRPAATDGYWLMLRPLAPGRHRIAVRAHYQNPGHDFGELDQVFEYWLEVVPSVPELRTKDPAEDDDKDGNQDDAGDAADAPVII
jgi:hypothetical protein